MLISHQPLWLTSFLGGQPGLWTAPCPMRLVMLVQRNPLGNPLLSGCLLPGGFRDFSHGPSSISILSGVVKTRLGKALCQV